MDFLIIMTLAMGVDRLVGWPDPVFRLMGHPVTWIGAVIRKAEQAFNKGSDRQRLILGGVTVLITLAPVLLVTIVLQTWLLTFPWGGLGIGVLCWPLLASKSLFDHVRAVYSPLAAGSVEEARQAVSMIVGRDTEQLDEKAIGRAAMESLAENSSDGIFAPLFWGCLFGLPGIAGYKAINTLDSMIGYRNDRYEYFGKIAARLDDVVNWIPARLTGLLLALVSLQIKAIRVIWQDAGKHRSPNAGWPEAAIAGALDIKLSGPRIYGAAQTSDPWVNETGNDLEPGDLKRGIALVERVMLLLAVMFVVVAGMG